MTDTPHTDWIASLQELESVSIQEHHLLSQHTPLRVGGPADCWIRCSSISGVKAVLSKTRQQSWRIHWPFEDWLVKDGGIHGIVIRLEDEFEQIRIQDGHLELGTAALWSNLSSWVGLHDAAAELQHWSGSVGAALMDRNAEKLFDGFEIEVEWIKGRNTHRRTFDKNTPLSIPDKAIPVVIKIRNTRKSRKAKPIRSGHVFSIDKGYTPKELLTELSLNSVRLRQWKVCQHNPNFVIHNGVGHIQDLKLLQQALNQRLQPARNVKLNLRMPLIGRKTTG